MWPYDDDSPQCKIVVVSLFLSLLVLIVAAQVFYIRLVKHIAIGFRKEVVRRGRLISVLPIISTIGATMPVQINIQPTAQVPSAPSNIYPPNTYTAPDGSRVFDDKVAPPEYVP
ncbi:uncharacterized protein [Diabrotica undecimpunctata]|uniref:uncharacterized protein isoform X4 n=1 Tax=Diabrotica undecimpunctata TaxID=50387 RepID=UPI003B63FAE5